MNLDRYLPRPSTDLGLLVLRAMLAVVFFFHGSQKLFGWFGGYGLDGTSQWMASIGIPLPYVSTTMAALSEFGGSLVLLTGIAFRPVMLPLTFTMLVAAFTSHAGKGFSIMNGGNEYALTLAAMVLGLFFTGPGRFALQPSSKRMEARAS